MILHTENSFLSLLFIVAEKYSIRRIQIGRYGVLGWIPWSARYVRNKSLISFPIYLIYCILSAEYKRSLGEVFSLAVGKGFINDLSVGRKDKDVQAILKATPSVDPTSSSTFMEEYNKLFDKRYPYVYKVARAYLLDPTGLQNIMPDETGPTPGQGPRDTPMTSYA
ncbi:hypothetical protein Tco_0613032 [Tanacetum coccineum]